MDCIEVTVSGNVNLNSNAGKNLNYEPDTQCVGNKQWCDADCKERSFPPTCVISSCPNSLHETQKINECIYYDFPKDETLLNVWRRRCGLSANFDATSAKICSYHFSTDSYGSLLSSRVRQILNPNAVPNKNLISDSSSMNFVVDKKAVDENECLLKRYSLLLNAQKGLKDKIYMYDKKTKMLHKRLVHFKSKFGKLRERYNNTKPEKDLLSEVFSESQVNILLGRKKVVWSNDDLANAFTLRHIGGKDCYLYLKNTLNIPLPSLSCVQKWAASCT